DRGIPPCVAPYVLSTKRDVASLCSCFCRLQSLVRFVGLDETARPARVVGPRAAGSQDQAPVCRLITWSSRVSWHGRPGHACVRVGSPPDDQTCARRKFAGSPAPNRAARNRRGDASGDEAPFRLGNRFANELQGEARVAVDKVDSHGLAIDDRQRVAQLVSDVALVARIEQRLYEGEIEVVLE